LSWLNTPISSCTSAYRRFQRPDPSGSAASRHGLFRNRKPSRQTLSVAAFTVLAAGAAASLVALWPASAATAPASSATGRANSAVLANPTAGTATSTITIALAPPEYGGLHAVRAYLARQQAWPGQIRTQVLISEQLPAPAPSPRSAVTARPAAPQQPAAPTAAPVPAGAAQQIALAMLGSYGWPASQFSCLQPLWARESGWNVYASSPTGAYGIPQALPGSKMASAGPDWQTDAATQIRWGLSYISSRYGSPCAAWAHSQATGWY
jgi:hypothetical protein